MREEEVFKVIVAGHVRKVWTASAASVVLDGCQFAVARSVLFTMIEA